MSSCCGENKQETNKEELPSEKSVKNEKSMSVMEKFFYKIGKAEPEKNQNSEKSGCC